MRSFRSVVLVALLLAGGTLAGPGRAGSITTQEISLSEASLTFWGDDAGDWSGYSVSPAGDVNNDGYDDIVIGAPYAGEGPAAAEGKAYLVLGRPLGQWSSDHIDLEEADASFIGHVARSMAGRQNYTAGDVNGDGYGDFLVSLWKYGPQRGMGYLFLGRPNVDWGHDFLVDGADATFFGEDEQDRASYYVSTAGDVNADGLDDFLITATGDEEGGGFRAGQVYLILGREEADWGWSYDLGQADASFLGEAEGDAAGRSASGAGDVNGDGYDDFLIGASFNDEGGVDAGQAYLILGRAEADWGMDMPLSQVDASFIGEAAGDEVGRRVTGAGDVNGDGYADFMVGASYNDQAAPDAGKAYLFLGRPEADWGMDHPVALADASFLGEAEGDQAGRRVSDAGDLNNDGFADFAVGAPHNSRSAEEAGAAYLFYGRADASWGSDYPLSASDVIYVGEAAFDHAGYDISPAGDFDNDGIDDLLIGAWAADENGISSGQTYVLLSGGLSPSGPEPLAFAPDAPDGYVGEWHNYTTDYGDPDGWSDLASVQMVIGRDPDDNIAFNVLYEPAADALYLMDSQGPGWLGPCSPGDATKLDNLVVELDCRTTKASNDGDKQVRVIWTGRWTRPLDNPLQLNVYLRAVDQAGNDSGFVGFGTWKLLPEEQVWHLFLPVILRNLSP